jgi:hypothetical protein
MGYTNINGEKHAEALPPFCPLYKSRLLLVHYDERDNYGDDR